MASAIGLESVFSSLGSGDYQGARQRLQEFQDQDHLEELFSRDGPTFNDQACTMVPTILMLLMSSESIYHSLKYLEFAGPRKDALREMYDRVCVDLNRLEDKQEEDIPVTRNSIRGMFRPLAHFVNCRLSMIKVYATLAKAAFPIQWHETVSTLTSLVEHTKDAATWDPMRPLQERFIWEVGSLIELIQCQMALSVLDVKECFLHLTRAKLSLGPIMNTNTSTNSNSNSNASASGSSSIVRASKAANQPEPADVFSWMVGFYHFLMAKASFYFRDMFQKYDMENEGSGRFGTVSRRYNIFNEMVESFVRKSEALQVALIMNCVDIQVSQYNGYKCPLPPQFSEEAMYGMSAWPVVYSLPNQSDVTFAHKPNIISLIQDEEATLSKYNAPVYLHDKKSQATYFLAQIEPRLILVVIFHGAKRAKTDNTVNMFLSNITSQLRGTQTLLALKPS